MRLNLCVLLSLVYSFAYSQTIYTVNNNPGAVSGVNNYANFTEAHDAASPGDIIYIVPSGTNYGAFVISKELTVFGIGLFPDTQTKLTSDVDNIDINASNVRISGLNVTSLVVAIKIEPNVINLTVEKCRYKRMSANEVGIANILIQNCVIGENYNYSADGHSRFSIASPNIRFSNNIIYANKHVSLYAVFYGLNGATFENNLFMNYLAGLGNRVFGSLTNCLIKNNIFFGASPYPRSTFTGNTIDYNMTFGSANNSFLTTGNLYGTNNQIGVDPAFVNVQNENLWSFNYDFSLMPGSTAIGAGDDGTDLGMGGGLAPFDPTATSLPLINSISVPAMISQGSQLPVKIKGRGN